jgi:hypothetical protein
MVWEARVESALEKRDIHVEGDRVR